MKNFTNGSLLFLSLLWCTLTMVAQKDTQKHLALYHPKDDYWALSRGFLQHMVELFGVTILVETGTCGGNTTNNARGVFTEIHSMELAAQLYEHCRYRFAQSPSVHLYCGDSAHILPSLLPTLTNKGRILFWLDGHYSGGRTVKGTSNTPIIGELKAIAAAGITNAIILIDDIRCFQGADAAPHYTVFADYPTCAELEQLVLEINPAYQFKLFEDIALAYLPSDNLIVSPVIEACTFCRMAEEKHSDETQRQKMLSILAAARGAEKETLKIMSESLYGPEQFNVGHHYRIWYALTLAHEGCVDQLYPLFAQGLPYYS